MYTYSYIRMYICICRSTQPLATVQQYKQIYAYFAFDDIFSNELMPLNTIYFATRVALIYYMQILAIHSI